MSRVQPSESPRRLQLLVGVLAAVIGLAGMSRAQAAVDLRSIDPELATLPFGKDIAAIELWVGKRLDRAAAGGLARAVDVKERARLRADRDRELEAMRLGEQVFDGRKTGLEFSIVAGEFGVGTGESLVQHKEGEETHYFFLRDGKVWKYLRVLSPAPTYLGRMASFQKALGEPSGLADESDGDGGRRLVSTTWRKGPHDLRLVNRRIIYGADVFVIEDQVIATELAEARKKAGQKGSSKDGSLDSYLLDDPFTYGAPPLPPPEPAPNAKVPPRKR